MLVTFFFLVLQVWKKLYDILYSILVQFLYFSMLSLCRATLRADRTFFFSIQKDCFDAVVLFTPFYDSILSTACI